MYEHDVIVVGAGGAGLRAAIAAHEAGADVAMMVSKLHPVRSHTGAAEGGINATLQEGDDWGTHAYDTMKGSDYPADAPAVEALAQNSPEETINLEHWGMPFSREDDGRVSSDRSAGSRIRGPPTPVPRRDITCCTRCTSRSSSEAFRSTTSGT